MELRALLPKPAVCYQLLCKTSSTFKLVCGVMGQSYKDSFLFFFLIAEPLRDFTMLKCNVTLQERVRGQSLLTVECFFSKKYQVNNVENSLVDPQKVNYTITI